MSGPSITYRVSFRTARQPPKNGNVEPPKAATPKPPPKKDRTVTGGPSRAARLLALAYFVERGIDAAVFQSYGDAARRIGITAGRMTQLANLLSLAPEIQEGLLAGRLDCGERKLREAAATPLWDQQFRPVSASGTD